MASQKISKIFGSDPDFTKLQILIIFCGLIAFNHWVLSSDGIELIVGHILFSLPISILLLLISNRVLKRHRQKSEQIVARIGLFIGFALLIPKWLLLYFLFK